MTAATLSGEQKMAKAKGFTYSAQEVVSLWVSWCNRSMRDYNPDTLSRPGTRDTVDPRQRAYMWVESFFRSHIVLAYDRAHWLLGIPSVESAQAFDAWYKEHPLPRLLSGDQVASLAEDFKPMTASEAAAHLKCTPRAIQLGAKDGQLVAWRPKGMGWHTNRFWLDKWKEEHPAHRPKKVAS